MSVITIRRSLRVSPLLAAALIVASATSSLATEPSNFHGTPLSRGTFAAGINLNTGAARATTTVFNPMTGRVQSFETGKPSGGLIEFETDGSVDFATSTVTLDAPSSSGWHTHPGVVLVTILSGSLVFYDQACTGTVMEAGTSFVESGGRQGLVRNESTTTPAVVYATYIVPTETPKDGLRLDAENPGCTQS